jgi:glyoxylase-like metal-dependent hydrolase (beta-lactamase superfamily II)
VSYLLDRGAGFLFVGDAAASARGSVRLSPRPVTADRDAAARSLAKLAAMSFDVAVFGHGDPLRGDAVEKFRQAVAD